MSDSDPSRGNEYVADVVGIEPDAPFDRVRSLIENLIVWLGQREPVAPGDPFTKFITGGRLVSLGLVKEADIRGDDNEQPDDEDAIEPEMVVVHAREMFPSVTNGCGTLTITELASTKPNLQTLEFVKVGQTSAQFMLIMPPGWVGGSFQFRVYWSHSTGGSTFGTAWRLRAHSVTDGETMSEAFSGSMLVTDTGGTADDLYISPESDPVQISGTQAKAGDLVMCEISRIVTDDGDTLNIPARLHAIRFNVGDAPAEFPPTGDPYWADVVLLVQDGADGTYAVQDRSTHADSVTIANYAEWDSAEQLFGVNTIKETTLSPAIPGFTSSGYTSRFGRATGDLYTFECWLYVNVTENYSVSAMVFSWWHGTSDRIFELTTYANSTNLALRIRNGDDASIETELLTSNEWHFVQVNFDGSDYTVDLNGVEVYSGTNLYGVNVAGDFRVQVASQTAAGSSTAPTTQVWVTPFRVTKGVLRTRGVVPTDVFPTSG